MWARVLWAAALVGVLSVEPSEPPAPSMEECIDQCIADDEDESMTPEQCEEDCHDSPAFEGVEEI